MGVRGKQQASQGFMSSRGDPGRTRSSASWSRGRPTGHGIPQAVSSPETLSSPSSTPTRSPRSSGVGIVGPDGRIDHALAGIDPFYLNGLLELGTLQMLTDFVVHPTAGPGLPLPLPGRHSRGDRCFTPADSGALFGHTTLTAGRVLLESAGTCTGCGFQIDLTRDDARDRVHIHTADPPTPHHLGNLKLIPPDPEGHDHVDGYGPCSIRIGPRKRRRRWFPPDWPATLCDSCRDRMRRGRFTSFLDYRFSLHPRCPSCSAQRSMSTAYGFSNGSRQEPWVDIYGELMDSVYLCNKYGLPIYHDGWMELTRNLEWLMNHWDQPDEGIWETRGGRRNYTYSRLMSWVAFERAIRVARQRGLPADIPRWSAVRDRIYKQIMERGWHPARQAFVQHYDTDVLDASLLLVPLCKFVAPTDPRWISTLDAITAELVLDSLVYRYNVQASPDGLAGEEATFSMCSFWWVEALARAGRLDEARLAFEKMLTYANHVGLYSEEIGPTGEQLGNFPQALTHLALISAAYNLDRRLS